MKHLSLGKTVYLIGMILTAFALSSCSQPVPTPPIPKGQVGIHVEFKKLSAAQFNELTAHVKKMAEERNAIQSGDVITISLGDYNTYHGFWNDGFVDQNYSPNHPIPSPEVEADMKAQLDSFLKKQKVDPAGVKLELRYGP